MAAPAHTELDAAGHMDGIYRYQRHIYDATRKFYLLGRDRLITDLAPPSGGHVLEMACGTGRNLIQAARRYPDATFYGFDVSQEMLATARGAIDRAGLSGRIVLAEGDATTFDSRALFDRDGFDRVFISYALSMIPPWQIALDAAMVAVRPGGALHVVDFGQQSRWPAWFQSGLQAWLARFSVTPRAGLDIEMARVAAAHGRSLQFVELFGDYARYGVIR